MPSTPDMASVLEVRSLSHTYASRGAATTALSDVSFRARAGFITAVVGPNGSGKSTLFKLLAGLLRVQCGEIRLVPGEGKSGHAVLSTGVVFQSPSLDGQLTVFENLYHHALLYGLRVSRASLPAELLDVLELRRRLDERVETLSGGFQRRVEIAKALVVQPDCLIMDEPFNGLDVRAREELLGLVRTLAHRRGLAVLMVTHDQRIATSCDTVVVLEEGRLVADATPSELLRDFGDTVVEIGSTAMDRVLECLRVHMDVVVHRLGGERAVVSRGSAADVWNALEPVRREVSHFEARTPSIEDYLLARNARQDEGQAVERIAV